MIYEGMDGPNTMLLCYCEIVKSHHQVVETHSTLDLVLTWLSHCDGGEIDDIRLRCKDRQ